MRLSYFYSQDSSVFDVWNRNQQTNVMYIYFVLYFGEKNLLKTFILYYGITKISNQRYYNVYINWRRGELRLEVYIDILFFWNVVMNIALLYITKWLRKQKTSFLRILLGAMYGGLISCATTVLSEIPSIITLIVSYVMTGIVMIFIVFGKKDKRVFWNNFIYFIIVTFVIGGMIESLLSFQITSNVLQQFYQRILHKNQISVVMILGVLMIVIPIFTTLILKLKKKTKEEHCYYKVKLILGDICIPCQGFLDTGNSLYDPMNGKPVIIVDRKLLNELYEQVKLNRPERIRVIPYRCVGVENGLLEGIRFDEVVMENENESSIATQIVAALSEYEFKEYNDYQVLLHSDLI